MRHLLALLTILLLAGSFDVSAQATRTWVSGVGDDANPCSRTAPCKTFAGAIAKTQAAGEIDVLDPGGFGAVTITKSITIDGGSNIAGVLVSGTNGIVVAAGSTDTVILRNIDFDGLTTGLSAVTFVSAGALHIENSTVMGFGASSSNSINVPLPAAGLSTDVSLRNVRVYNCIGTGIAIGGGGTTGTLKVTLDRVQVANCPTALAVSDGTTTLARDSDFSHSSIAGVTVTSASVAAKLSLEHTLLTQNTLGALASGALATLRLSDSTVLDNTTGLSAASGAAIVSFTNNRLKGNGTDGAPTLNVYQR